jgi:outer membrane protein TolC
MFTVKSMFCLRSKATIVLAVTGLIALGVLALAPDTVHAQSPSPASPSPSARALLDGYVTEALSANLAIAQQNAALRRATATVREANGRFLPTVGVNARYSEFSGVVNIGDFINPAYAALNQLIGQERFPTNVAATLPFRQETKLEMSVPLYNDALFGARAAARAQRDLVGSGRAAAMRQLAADVQQAWLGYATTVRAVETLEATSANGSSPMDRPHPTCCCEPAPNAVNCCSRSPKPPGSATPLAAASTCCAMPRTMRRCSSPTTAPSWL